MSAVPDPVAHDPAPPNCYAHPGRVAGSVCRRCGRPICPDCMREAPVGWQCDSCVRQGARSSPVVRWRPSGGVGGGGVGAGGAGGAPRRVRGGVGRSRGAGRLGNTRVTPVVIALIVINVAVYLYEQGHPAFVDKYSLVPFYVHYAGRWYELITSAFLHENATHILLNMITLAIVGPPVEAEMGRLRFGALYLLSALGGSVGYYILAPDNVAGLGASGAIFGLMGAYFVIAKLRGWQTQSIAVLLVVNVLYSFSGGVAWQAHLGGLVVGGLAALGLMWTPGRLGRPSEMGQVVQALAVVIAGVIVLGLLVQIPPGHVNV